MSHFSEWLTIFVIGVIVVVSEAHMPPEMAKDIALAAVSGFLGYLAKTAVDALKKPAVTPETPKLS